MSDKKADRNKAGELSEPELEAVSGGEDAIMRPIDPNKCSICRQPLIMTPTGYYCSNCGSSLAIEIR